MSEENTNDPTSKASDVLDPKGQPEVDKVDVSGLVNKNSELLGEIVKLKGEKKERDELIDKAKTEVLKENEKYKELSEKLEADKIADQGVLDKANKRVENANLKLLGVEMVNPQEIINNREHFEFDENHNITNAEKGLEKLKAEKAYLFKSPQQPGAVTVRHGNPVVNTGTGIPENIDVEAYKKNPEAVDAVFDTLLKGAVK